LVGTENPGGIEVGALETVKRTLEQKTSEKYLKENTGDIKSF
jgi:hypothetical protein